MWILLATIYRAFFFKHMGGLGPISPLLSRAAAFNSLGAGPRFDVG